MKRIMRRIVVLLATLVAAFVAAGPGFGGTSDGGGFYAQTQPAPTCSDAVSAAVAAILSGQPVDVDAILSACKR